MWRGVEFDLSAQVLTLKHVFRRGKHSSVTLSEVLLALVEEACFGVLSDNYGVRNSAKIESENAEAEFCERFERFDTRVGHSSVETTESSR